MKILNYSYYFLIKMKWSDLKTFFKSIKNIKYLFFVIFLHSVEVSATDKDKNLYRTLGVSPQADTAEIRRTYRKLAQKWHPDKNSSPNAEAMFMEIRQAYETLKDPDQRRRYDRSISTNSSNNLWGNSISLETVFNDMEDFIRRAQQTIDEIQQGNDKPEQRRDIFEQLHNMRVSSIKHEGRLGIKSKEEVEAELNRLQFEFYKMRLDLSSWKDLTEKEKISLLQSSMSVVLNNSEDKKLRKQALDVLDSVQLSESELNQLNHLANDKKVPRAIRSKARKVVKKASQSGNTCLTMFRI